VGRGRSSWLEAGLTTTLAAIAAVSWFNSWFLVWPLALAAVVVRARAARGAIVFTLTALLAGVALSHRTIWPGGQWPFEPAQALAGALTFLPPLVAWGRRRPIGRRARP
jgi:hypothetical protein